MNNQRTSLVLFLFITLVIFCCKNKEQSPMDVATQIQSAKEYPNDLFSFQRSYPYKKLDVRAYEAGMQEATFLKQQRNTTPGLDQAWTNQGPGNAGGRANTIAVHPSDASIVYLGFATGGVWKTTDGGTTWNPVFDDQPFQTVSDITLDPSDPQTIYVGTGDANISGYPAIGNGVYKSTDGGTTWTHLGLTDQRIVSKIIVHPTAPNTIYVSCMGLPFERNNDRGLYKTTDGGANWEQVLFVSNQSGIIDMVMNPNDPDVIYAASWDRIRNNEESVVFGPNALIHKTADGGTTWTVLTNGLPSGNLGRIGLAMAGSDSDILVASYVAANQRLEGIYRTEDAGASWSAIPSDAASGILFEPMGSFGWYFGKIRIHPTNPSWIYLLGVSSWFTSNNGNNWSLLNNGSSLNPHADHHDLDFDANGDLILATDGGAYKRKRTSINFTDLENIPATQFYRVAYDPHRPDSYYGGSQDNGTQAGNEATMNTWDQLLGGDGFQMQFDPVDSNIVYAETQNGNIFRTTSGPNFGFVSSTAGIGPTDRRNWDMQYIISPHDHERLYTGTYRVYKSQSSGTPFWQAISGDLTDGIVFGSIFHTISTLTESPLVEDLLYVGTTDANVWRTDNGGTNWTQLDASLPNRYITSIKASPDFADHVYVTISGYRYNENIPRVYKSTDRGATWTSIAGNLPDIAINDIFVLPNEEDRILFVATDAGVYVSTNAGVSWELLGTGMPNVTVYDMVWNEVNNQLVAGTFGRSIYTYPIDSILNNLDPVFTVSGEILNADGVGVNQTTVESSSGTTTETGTDGAYEIGGLSVGTDCTIRPSKDINIRNGVSTFDIVKMQAHILTIDPLDSPYKILAGDVNSSGNLSTFDLVILRKVILFNQDTFNNTASWRFVPADFTFADPINPFLDNFPGELTCQDIQNGASGDFIGIKMGDVTGNANPANWTDEPERRADRSITFSIKDRLLKKGETYRLPIYASDFRNITGLQLGLQFSDQLEFLNLESGGINLSTEHYFYDKKTRNLRLSWTNPYSTTLGKEIPIIWLNISGLGGVRLSEAIEVNSNDFSAEVYTKTEDLLSPELIFKTTNKSSIALEVLPNPFSDQTTLNFELESEGQLMLQLFDLNGRLIYQLEQAGSKGTNAIQLSEENIKSKGVLFYQLITASENYSGTLIRY